MTSTRACAPNCLSINARFRILGHASAQFNLALKYEAGQGLPRDYVEAVRWYRKAAEQGEAKAQNNLGLIYAHDVFLDSDQRKGEAHRTFTAGRDGLAKKMSAQQIAEAQRLAREWKPKPVGTRRKTDESIPDAFIGEQHRAFFGRSAPCNMNRYNPCSAW